MGLERQSQNSFKEAEAGALKPRGRQTPANPFVAAEKKKVAAAAAPTPSSRKRSVSQGRKDSSGDESSGDESAVVKFKFVEDDADGPELPPKAPRKKLTTPRKLSVTGVIAKAPDKLLIHSKGATNFEAKDGRTVSINLGKLMMLRLTEEQLESPEYKGLVDHNGLGLSTDHFECLVPSGESKHVRFHLVKQNTANVSKHAKNCHDTTLEALARIIKETPAVEALQACVEYISALAVQEESDLFRFWNIQDGERISKETCALIWFIDAFVPFSQFDNPLFKQFCEKMSGSIDGALSSTTTIMETMMPALYEFAMDENLNVMKNWVAFFNTFDGWSKFHRSFMSQNYHGIDQKTFEFNILLLDLIPFPAQKFRETIGAALVARQQVWTEKLGEVINAGGLDSWAEPIAAGGLADQASNVQDAGDFIWGEDDMSKCQCHVIGRVYVDMENGAAVYVADYNVLAMLCSFIASNGNVMISLRRHQAANALAELHVVLSNATRWNGRFRVIERVLELSESIIELVEVPEVKAMQLKVHDFLSPAYFTRLRGYIVLLKVMNDVTTFYETQRFPVGCFVPLLTIHLFKTFSPSEMDPPYVSELKREVFASMERRLSCLTKTNNFLLAALLHPGACAYLIESKMVSSVLLDAAFERIVDQAELIDTDSTELVRASLKLYREKHLPTGSLPIIDIAEISKEGTFWGCNHMVMWKGVVTGTHAKLLFAKLFSAENLFPI
jgi:hypothetical protein